jgi:error-prone DNA polymerase
VSPDSIQLSLRAHPLSFVRDDLRRRGVVSAADLERIKDGRYVEVAGIILVRQKRASVKGILFITIKDETGVASGILWPNRFEAQRRTALSSPMVGLKGGLEREVVTHVIIDKVVDDTEMLRGIGGMSFPHRPRAGDGAMHGGGGPDPRDARWPKSHDGYYPPFDGGADPEDVIRVKSHDFHQKWRSKPVCGERQAASKSGPTVVLDGYAAG